MTRTKGAINKDKLPTELSLSPDERVQLLADLIVEAIEQDYIAVSEGTNEQTIA